MASKRRKQRDSAPGWAWMLFGLSIGLGVALVVYLKSGAPPTALDVELTASRTAAETSPSRAAPREPETPVEAPGESDPALSFYTDLREVEVVVPDGEFDFDSGGAALGNVVIQAGSFPEVHRADARKAELALLGIESKIEPAVVSNETFYRVVIGPLGQSERGRINRILRQLNEREIESFARVVAD